MENSCIIINNLQGLTEVVQPESMLALLFEILKQSFLKVLKHNNKLKETLVVFGTITYTWISYIK